jgi:hypothetical protein
MNSLSALWANLLNRVNRPVNQARMAAWTANVNRIVAKPPGNDEGFTPEDIARSAKLDFSRFSSWEIICEEVLDTTFPRAHHERAREELHRRGICNAEIEEMRRVAWLTAGWLNFEKMLWDWCSLSEADIYRAIRWQYREGCIVRSDRDRLIEFTRRYDDSSVRSLASELRRQQP